MASDLTAWLDGLVALADRATQGPWRAVFDNLPSPFYRGLIAYTAWSGYDGNAVIVTDGRESTPEEWRPNTELIAALDPATVRVLVGVVKAGKTMGDVLAKYRHKLGGDVNIDFDNAFAALNAALRAAEACR